MVAAIWTEIQKPKAAPRLALIKDELIGELLKALRKMKMRFCIPIFQFITCGLRGLLTNSRTPPHDIIDQNITHA
jgi:hypothetical protein